jgi:asparagine synthase (glutamine-hydrolysing)
MAGIAGIAVTNAEEKINEMLRKMRHRGSTGISVFEKEGTTVGMIWNESESNVIKESHSAGSVGYENSPGHYIKVKPAKGKFIMCRDELGVAPLYYGKDSDGNICFASEVKALLPLTSQISEVPPAHFFDGYKSESFFALKPGIHSEESPEKLALTLRENLDKAVQTCITSKPFGSWLSGGLDSSTISALAAPHVKQLHTFASGLKGAPDLEYAKGVAEFIGSEHHEIVVTIDDLLKVLPRVIYHLESFDALLVRSSITNYLVAKLASDFVSDVFSGEGGDELFGGYDYLKSIPEESLEDELVKITGNLHNTALQRVDRSASAHGTVAHVVFANPEIVKFAFTIPTKYKIHNGTEKWILRKAMEGLLPESVLLRPKSKFWEGAGIEDLLSNYAEENISDRDFRTERNINGGILLNTKEELYYYRIFRNQFGTDLSLSWMGRTKGSPVA